MNQAEYENLKRERDVVAKAHDCLKLSQFPGHLAQEVAISQIYLKGLVDRLDVEIKKQAAANEPMTQPMTAEGSPVISPLADTKLPDPNGDKATV